MNTVNLESFKTVTADHPRMDVSDKYRFIPTVDVLKVLQDSGWVPAKVSEARTVKPERRGFQKHIVRLRHPGFPAINELGNLFPEIVVVNSHDRSSAFHLMAGMFRMVCTNGLITGDTFNSQSIRHIGYTADRVLQATDQLTQSLPRMVDTVQKWHSIELTRDEQGVFARASMPLRWDEQKNYPDERFLLKVNRWMDDKPSLWNTYNTVQENLTKGVRRNFRKITGVNRDVQLNRALWTLTEEFAKLKG